MATLKVLDAAWMHCTEVEGNKRKVKCNYCSKVIWGITRLKEHLARVGTDVTGCPDVTSEVSEEMRNSLVQFRQKVGQGSRGASNGTFEESLQVDAHTGYRQTTGHAFHAPASSAYIASFPDGSRNIQRPPNDVYRAGREDVHRPTNNHNQLVLQQHHWPPSNVAVTNAYTVLPIYQVPIAFVARPTQIACPSPTVTPSRLSGMCHACGSGYGVWGGYQSTPLNEIQCHADSAALGQGFQLTLHNSQTHLQNQLSLEAHQQQQMGLEQKPLPLPLLSNMFDAGTSSAIQNHQTTDKAAPNRQQLPSAHRSDINLELQLRIKPPSPDVAR